MNLKNYTSSVPVERSIMMIEKLLMDAGALNISKTIESNKVTGMVFQIMTEQQMPVVFKLPSKVDQCFKMMEKNRSPRSIHRQSVKDNLKLQAERTAWKLLFDWVAIQVSMIQIKQVELLEVFLPYAYDYKNEQTFFEKAKGTGFKQLTQEN
jgi:antitoxin component of RelBE/YafQ-DinJ toxin-antitoxin module